MKKHIQIAKKMLGDDIFDIIKKSDGFNIFKPESNTALDPQEMKIALQIVPRAILSYLILNLKNLEKGNGIELDLPFADGKVHITKVSNDVYSGEIYQNGQKKTDFKYRSLPGIGLILMSNFELYDMADYGKIHEIQPCKDDKMSNIQDIIDERLKLHCLIKDVVDKRISEREAIQKLINDKISESIEIEDDEEDEEDEDIDFEEESEIEDLEGTEGDIMDSMSKKSKLREFLHNREKKRQEKVTLDKSEKIECPDCKTTLYKGEDSFNLCLCYGQHYNKDIKIKKTEDGKYKFKFPKTFETDNVELLLDAIKTSKNS